ncbi:nucleotidyltransferase family protein [Derxia gummosa]|uniref:Nucleotidyltransferase family protein n=1 Tax=Derxia gummosa DSM 723 TaxID=1121388 RepID=A0A9U5G0E0_9BURK|nr:nucleotidyltransferase family protein [Derxia gummosa]
MTEPKQPDSAATPANPAPADDTPASTPQATTDASAAATAAAPNADWRPDAATATPAASPFAKPEPVAQTLHFAPRPKPVPPKPRATQASETAVEPREATPEQLTRVEAILRADAGFMAALEAVRALGLPDACIGAGAIRNRVWDALHGYAAPSGKADIDVLYFDAAETGVERDRFLEHRLAAALPDAEWEVVNQAGVHRWFEEAFGYEPPMIASLAEGIGSWPEVATCVAARLAADGSLQIIAPYGLDDLLGLVCRRNAGRTRVGTYRARLLTKGWKRRWPKLSIV